MTFWIFLKIGTKDESYQKSDSNFRILGRFPTKNVKSDFPYLDPFTCKIEPERWDHSDLYYSILHSQIEDNGGLLQ